MGKAHQEVRGEDLGRAAGHEAEILSAILQSGARRHSERLKPYDPRAGKGEAAAGTGRQIIHEGLSAGLRRSGARHKWRAPDL